MDKSSKPSSFKSLLVLISKPLKEASALWDTSMPRDMSAAKYPPSASSPDAEAAVRRPAAPNRTAT